MTPRALLPVSAFLVATAATAFAQDMPDPPPVSTSPDPRWALYTSCTVVFAAIVAYLVATHRRAAALTADVDAIERRLDELESREAG